jgi:hypothetical protein
MVSKKLLIIVAALMVSSCSPPEIQMDVKRVDGRLRVTLFQDWGIIFSNKKTPCVREAGLYQPGTYGRNAAAWLIEAKGDVQCLDLGSLTIGVAPNGFDQSVPFRAVRGERYTLRVGGIGWGETEVQLSSVIPAKAGISLFLAKH